MPNMVIQRFADSDEFNTAIRNWVRGVVTARGTYKAELTLINFDRLWMSRGEESLPRVTTLTPSVERTTLLFATDQNQAAQHIAGIEVSPDEAALVSFGTVTHVRTSAATRWGGVSLTPRDLADIGQAIDGRPLTPPSFTHRIRLPAPLLSRLRNLHAAAGHLARTTPSLLANPEVARAIEQGLMEAMVSCVASTAPVDVRSVHHRHLRVLRRLEEVLQANADRSLYMTELCAAAGASYSTLRSCCQEYLGMSPKRYLWLRRMHLVRQELRRADPDSATVTDIATKYGFWELGRFSVAYRSLFAELPSAALRRPPDDLKSRQDAGSPWEFANSA